MKTPKRAILLAAGAAALLLAGSGATAAVLTIPSANGVIHGCYGSTGALRVVNALTCPSGQKALSWNAAGSLSTTTDTGFLYERAQSGGTPTCTLDQTGGPDHLTATETDLEGWEYYSGPTCDLGGFPRGAFPVVSGLEGWSGKQTPWIHLASTDIYVSATDTPTPGVNELSFVIVDPPG